MDLMENGGLGALLRVIMKGTLNTGQKSTGMINAYLELGNNFIFGHIHEVHIFHCKGRERDNGKKSSVNLLRRWCSWQHGEQNRLNEKQRGGLNLGSINSCIQYLEAMTLAPRNIWMSLPILSRAFSYQYGPRWGTSPAQPMIPVPCGRGEDREEHGIAQSPCWELLVSLPWGPSIDLAVSFGQAGEELRATMSAGQGILAVKVKTEKNTHTGPAWRNVWLMRNVIGWSRTHVKESKPRDHTNT